MPSPGHFDATETVAKSDQNIGLVIDVIYQEESEILYSEGREECMWKPGSFVIYHLVILCPIVSIIGKPPENMKAQIPRIQALSTVPR